jgi:hypothetical protein
VRGRQAVRGRSREVVVAVHGERLQPRARARGRELRAGVQQHQLALRQAHRHFLAVRLETPS